MVTISLDLHQRLYPVLYEYSRIPASAQQVLPVPAPVGGFLIIGGDFILYGDQTTLSGAALNSHAKMESLDIMRQDLSEHNIDASNCQAVFLAQSDASTTPPLLLGLKDGEYWLVELGSRTFESFRFKKVAHRSVIPSSLTNLDDSFFFIGSRLGDSLLVRRLAPKTIGADHVGHISDCIR